MASPNADAVETMFQLARRADHRTLRTHLHDDVTWHPAQDGAWKACTTAEEVVRTLLWRASANRLRPREMIDLGDPVFVQPRGWRLERLRANGFTPRACHARVVR